ncbi:unnamed protein product [Peniophora sp. CBMAI 1063]|nr:unnamed protein product [Peniophora sp. CBMAI 1063]
MRVDTAERPQEDPLFASPDDPHLTPPLYNQLSEHPLGAINAPEDDEQMRCFNCGELGHRLQTCTERRDRQRIASARMRFEEDGLLNSPWGSLTGHSSIERRLAMLMTFSPGEVRGTVLRDALGLLDYRDRGYHAPWLANMAQWGYPPGWCSSYDPMVFLQHHVVTGGQDGGASKLFIFGDAEVELLDLSNAIKPLEAAPTPDCEVTEQRMPSTRRPPYMFPPRRRWVFYPFSDELPVYDGRHLPSMGINISLMAVPRPFYPVSPSLLTIPPPPSLAPPPPPPGSPPPLPISSPPPLPPTENVRNDILTTSASAEGESDMEISSDSDS